MSTIVVMPGGFHPFHAGHLALYQSAQRAFPDAEVFVAATNDTSARPFPFALKEKLAQLAGVEPGHFVQVKSPFRAEEITSQFDPASDVLIFVRSEKDSTKPPQAGGNKKDGSPAYLQPLIGAKRLEPFARHAYMAYLPTVEFGPGMTSATEIRSVWPKLNEKRKTALVMSLYPATQSNPALAATVVKMLDTAMVAESINPMTANTSGAGAGMTATWQDRYNQPAMENQGWAATYEEENPDYIEEKWSAKYKRSINCANPRGFSQRAHCAGRKKNEDVVEAFGPLPKDNQQIRLGRHTVDIERVGLNNNYIGFTWHDSRGQEHYEEVPVGDLGSYDDLIEKIKQEISYQERKYTDQGVAEGSTDTVYPNATVIKSKNGRPVGEIYQDGNSWGCFHYRADRGYDFIDSREDAIQALKDLHQETGRSGPDYTIKGVAEGSGQDSFVQRLGRKLQQSGYTQTGHGTWSQGPDDREVSVTPLSNGQYGWELRRVNRRGKWYSGVDTAKAVVSIFKEYDIFSKHPVDEGLTEGLAKDIKRLATGKDVKSRAGQEIAKSQDASMKGDIRTSKKHFDRYDRLDKLANKQQGVAEGSQRTIFTDEELDAINQYLDDDLSFQGLRTYPGLIRKIASHFGIASIQGHSGEMSFYDRLAQARAEDDIPQQGVAEAQLAEKCWDTHRQVGMKKKGNRMVPNCVPKESK